MVKHSVRGCLRLISKRSMKCSKNQQNLDLLTRGLKTSRGRSLELGNARMHFRALLLLLKVVIEFPAAAAAAAELCVAGCVKIFPCVEASVCA